MSRVEYLPKTNAYIDWVFDSMGSNRGGHHNYVAEQAVGDLCTAFVKQTKKEQEKTDESIFKRLHDLDNNPDYVIIKSEEIFDECVELIRDFENAACTIDAIDGLEIQFEVEACKDSKVENFIVAFQSVERNNGLMAYNGYEVGFAGYDSDDSQELIEFMDYDESSLDMLCNRAKALSKSKLCELLDNE